MKKIFAYLLVMVMVFSLFACGEGKKPDDGLDNNAQNGDGTSLDADPLFMKDIEAAVKKMNDSKGQDISATLSIDIKSSGMVITLPVQMSAQIKWTGNTPEKIEDLDTIEELNALGLQMKLSYDLTLPALIVPEGGNMKLEMYFADGMIYINNNGEKMKASLADIMEGAAEDEEMQVDPEQIIGLIQLLLKDVEEPADGFVGVQRTESDGAVRLTYTVKGTALYDYVKSALGTICANADSAEVKAIIDALQGETEEEEPLYSQDYDFSNIDWEEFFANELYMTVEEVKASYIDAMGEGEDYTDAEWESIFQMQFNPDAEGELGDVDSAMGFYNQIYGDSVAFSFNDAVYTYVLKDGVIASEEMSFGISVTQKATDEEEQDVTVEYLLTMNETVNAIGDAVVITAPADLDEYISMPEDLEDAENSDVSVLL